MNKILETERLYLRELNAGDAPFILGLVNTAGWLRFIGDRGIKTPQDATNYLLEGPLKSYELNGFGLWLVALKKDGMPIGMCGLLKREYLDCPDIGFAFLPEHQGKGYAVEAAKASMAYAKEVLGFTSVLATTKIHNILSISLLKKLGMQFDKIIRIPPGDEELMLFGIDWKERMIES